jgi:hypothetical protein
MSPSCSFIAAGDTALLGEVRHRRRSKEVAAEVAALEDDEQDRQEMLAVAELMEALRAPR